MGIINRFFTKKSEKSGSSTAYIDERTSFTTWSGDAYSSDVFRAGVDAIARHAAKLKGKHVIEYEDHSKREGDCKLNRLFSRPNPYMSGYDWLMKIVATMIIEGNSFTLIDRDARGTIRGFYPITSSSVEFMSDEGGNLFARFTFRDGKTAIFDYRDLIHLRRSFVKNELLGEDSHAVDPVIELAHVQNESITRGIKTSAGIRGLVSWNQIMSPSMLQESKDKFVADYLSSENDGGVVAVDNKMTFTPLDSKPIILSGEQTAAIEAKIYNFLGISKGIVCNNFTEDEYSAFFEGVIEPIAIQLSEECTAKIFNERERAFGNAIVFDAGRLIFSSNQTKIRLIDTLAPYGLLTINEAREILNLEPVSDGDKRLVSLNMIDSEIANEYQLQKSESSS